MVVSGPERVRGSGPGLWAMAAALWVLACSQAMGSSPLPTPEGEVLLVIDGAISNANVGDEAHFDLAMLQALPTDRFTTRTPWNDGDQTFEGARLSAVLDVVGAASDAFRAVGTDDYASDFRGVDVDRYPVLIAYLHNGKPMSLRQLGPLRIVLPFDDHPELATHENEAASVWQVIRLTIYE